MSLNNYHPDFYTATISEWKHLLKPDKFKDIIISSLKFLVENKLFTLYAFVPKAFGMHNHLHLIWQIHDDYKPKDIQQSFMKYTAQILLKELRNNHTNVLEIFKVNAKDRKYQIWERNALSISLWNRPVFIQKLKYLHDNPVRAGFCRYP